MQEIFNPKVVDRDAQQQWKDNDVYQVTEDKNKQKFYACSMLPYPSGNLHMGHVRNYTINDMLTRQLRMQGFNVLMPMGWDAFGLPAENAALKNQVPPAKWTYNNIAYMKSQMQAMGLAIDWSREIATCDPEYYKWNQWLFLKMLEAGIAYRKTQVVNWDPVDQTVLANEQVIDGRGWRTGALVEKKEIPGYYLKITDYAPELLASVQTQLPGWPERVKLMQENWIGKSQGVRFAFNHQIKDDKDKLIQDGRMYVFTTRADTIMGVTYCAIAPEHPLAEQAAKNNLALQNFIEECKKGDNTEAAIATQEKKGMSTGLTVTHPLTGEELPLWVANYVLMSYGDGAVMAVPAHDQRDFEFANKFNLPIKQVVDVKGQIFNSKTWQEWYADKQQGICINSDQYNGLNHTKAIDHVASDLAAKGIGEKTTTWRLRDWGISRQRYWGTPIPIIHCQDCGAQPVSEKDLPVVLPLDCVPDGSGNPLIKHKAFHAGVTCPACGKAARRETDTMDTFVDSSWYFLRYCDPHNNEKMVEQGANYWMPMDQYIGGIEHAILHLLYARFWVKVMRDLKLLNIDEPFTKLLTQGMVLNHIYSHRTDAGAIEYFWPHEVENIRDDSGKVVAAKLKSDGSTIDYGGIGTMSKSKNNGVDPKDLIEKYGADTARLYTMFTAPPEATLEWNDSAVDGAFRFLRRLWYFSYQQHATKQLVPQLKQANFNNISDEAKKLRLETHKVLQQINFDYQRMQYNTVVSGTMKLLNALEAFKLKHEADNVAILDSLSILLRTLYPVTPHICYVLWQQLGFNDCFGNLLDAPWPQIDDNALIQTEIELVLQINGKTRGNISIPANADKTSIEDIVTKHPTSLKFIQGNNIKKIIIVPKRLINIVV